MLLQLLSRLTGAELEGEAGTFRLHRLANMAAVVGLMQRERAKVEGLDTASLVEGDEHQTLRLVWSIIYRLRATVPAISPVALRPFGIRKQEAFHRGSLRIRILTSEK